MIVQTYSPKHYAIRAALEHDCDTFYREELEYRRLIGFPPWQRLVNIRLDSRSKERVRASCATTGRSIACGAGAARVPRGADAGAQRVTPVQVSVTASVGSWR